MKHTLLSSLVLVLSLNTTTVSSASWPTLATFTATEQTVDCNLSHYSDWQALPGECEIVDTSTDLSEAD